MTDPNRRGLPGPFVPIPMNNPPLGHPFYAPPINPSMSGGANPGLIPPPVVIVPPGVAVPPGGGPSSVGGWIGPPTVGNIVPGGVVPPPSIGVRLGPPPGIPPSPMGYGGGGGGVVPPPPVVPIRVGGGNVIQQGTNRTGADGVTTWGVGSLGPQGMVAAAARPTPRSPSLKIVGPRINVYVGQLTPNVPCKTIQALLMCCGELEKWTRAEDHVTGQPKKFGFATFRSGCEAARAVKYLNGLEVRGVKLLVKVGKKDQELVEQAIQAASQEGEEGKKLEKEEEGVLEKIKEIVAMPQEAAASAEEVAKNTPIGDSKRGKDDQKSKKDNESDDELSDHKDRFLSSVLVLKNGQGSEDDEGNTSDGYIDPQKAKLAFSEAVKFRKAQINKERRYEIKRREELQRRLDMQRKEDELRAKKDLERAAALNDVESKAEGVQDESRDVSKIDDSSLQPPPPPPPPPLPPADLPESTNNVEKISGDSLPSIDPAEEERRKRRRLEVLARLGNDDDLSGVNLSSSSAPETGPKSLAFSMAGTGKTGTRGRGSKNTTVFSADAGDEVGSLEFRCSHVCCFDFACCCCLNVTLSTL